MSIDEHQIWAVIPARGGSKGIPGKNLIELCGKPLIAHTIEAAVGVNSINRVIVSSDDYKILNFSSNSGAEIIKRPLNLALDDTPTAPVVEHILNEFSKPVDFNKITIILLQPTSPLRTREDIENALAVYRVDNKSTIISVYEPEHSPLKSFVEDPDGYLHGIINDEMPFMTRQALPKAYYPNGAIYVFNAETFMDEKQIPMKSCRPYIMPINRSIDIDLPADLHIASRRMKK